MVEAGTASLAGGLTGGITAPISTSINEISEIFEQLNRPVWSRTIYERDKYGNVLMEETWKVSKLDVIFLIGGPVCAVLVIAIMERLATKGGELSNWAKEAVGVLGDEAGEVYDLVKKSISDTDEQGFMETIGRLWGLVSPKFL